MVGGCCCRVLTTLVLIPFNRHWRMFWGTLQSRSLDGCDQPWGCLNRNLLENNNMEVFRRILSMVNG
ncbi:hypothetical protein [Candidatus Hodgkinia cicadicola]|uniref:hypothetical protein n=1 Tax=Candidatus Hodgkinia cicadicola TaxID=573658 RepID=UPI0011BAAFF8